MCKIFVRLFPLILLFVICMTPSQQAAAIEEGTLLVSLGTGYEHSCGLRSDGTIQCWGANNAGQSAPPTGTFLQLSGGYDHNCAVRTDNTLACWGGNAYGSATAAGGFFTQVSAGYDHTCAVRTDSLLQCWGWNDATQSSPPPGTFTQVSAGYNHSCGLKTDLTVTCWGKPDDGQLNAPTGTFTQIDAGDYFNCGVRTDGTLACWGRNTLGQSSPPGGTFTQVSAGGYHACAVSTAGTIVCWGWNPLGQTGAPGGTFTHVSAGFHHTCAVKTDATTQCWGANFGGQLNAPGSTLFAHPAIIAGGDHTCGLRSNGTVQCWGRNENGQSTPPAGTFTQISVGIFHTCGVRTDGSAACWGSNNFGQLNAPGGTFTQVSAGWIHTCGLRTDGGVTCWGLNDEGQSTPPDGTFIQISSGYHHMCAIRFDGKLACWGRNSSGQSNPPANTFIQISSGSSHTCGLTIESKIVCWGENGFGQINAPTDSFTQVSVGGDHTCGIKIDGTVACWGGISGFINLPGGAFMQVSGGKCGVRVDGTPVCWGANNYQQNIIPQPSVSLALSGSPLTEGSAPATVTVNPSFIPWNPITVQLGLSGTAGLNSDYTASSTSVTIPAQYASRTVTLQALNDGIDNEGDETIVVDGTSVTNATENGSQQVTAIIDENRAPTNLTLSNMTIAENTANVGSFSTSDPDTGDTFTYTLEAGSGDTDNASFTITGSQLSFNTAPDFETKSGYALRVRATDQGGLFHEKAFTVTVTDVNEFAPVLLDQAMSIEEKSANGTSIGTVSAAADGDTAQTLTYTVTGGTGQALFNFDPATREITVNSALDFEAATQYTLSITATDNGVPFQFTTATITVNLTDQNEFAPVLADQTFTIAENSASNSSVGTMNAAADGDTLQTMIYMVTGGTGQALFNFDPSTREITVNGALDFETTTSYTLNVLVTDNIAPTLSAAATLTINVTDVNEFAPTLEDQTFTIAENSATNSIVGTMNAAADGDSAQTLTYTVTGGTGQALFNFDTTTREITVSGALDFETATSYTLLITVTDNGVPFQFTTATITVNLTDQNEFAPVLDDQTFTIAENSASNSSVGTMNAAADGDTLQTMIYMVTGGTGQSIFNFDATTREITLNGALDFELTTSYTLDVMVTDSGMPLLFDTTTITINVVDENESAPVLIYQGFSIAENAANGVLVGTVSPAADSDTGQTLTYAVTGGIGHTIFNFDPVTREITVNGALDYETTGAYTLDITVTDSGTPPQSGTGTMTISLTDVNEFAPVLDDQTFTVAENSATGTIVGTLSAATDGDLAQPLTYAVTGGTGQSLFNFDTISREITVNGALDFETTTSYTLDIQVTDSGTPPQSDTAVITISLDDESVELLINGGFEIDTETPLKQPDNWMLTGKSKDKLKCNTTPPTSYEGVCAYMFKGLVGENAKLTQKLTTTLPSFTADDVLTMSVQYKTGASAPKLKVKVRVFYTSPTFTTGKLNQTINTVSNTAYSPITLPDYELEDSGVSKIKIQFHNKATSGKITIDAASLKLNN